MNDSDLRDLERRLPASLHAAAPRPSPGLADRLLARTVAAERSRGWRLDRFFPVLAAVAVVVLAIVVGLGIAQLAPVRDNVGDGVSPPAMTVPASSAPSVQPSPSPSAAAAASAGPQTDWNRCENDSLDYAVSYPADWWANEEIIPDLPGLDPIAACVVFATDPVELQPNAGLPAGVRINVSVSAELPPPSDGAKVISLRETTIAGRRAIVREHEEGVDSSFSAAGTRMYSWFVELPTGQYLRFGTISNWAGDYVTNKQVLDEMMESLELTGS